MITEIAASADDVCVVWWLDAAIDQWVGFEDELADEKGRHKRSSEWPIQKTSRTAGIENDVRLLERMPVCTASPFSRI